MKVAPLFKSHILAQAKLISDENKVIYFLIDKNEIVFIGVDTYRNVQNTINAHRLGKEFDRYFIQKKSNEELIILEKHYLKSFNPKYNLKIEKSYQKSTDNLLVDLIKKYDAKEIILAEIIENGINENEFKRKNEKYYLNLRGVIYQLDSPEFGKLYYGFINGVVYIFYGFNGKLKKVKN